MTIQAVYEKCPKCHRLISLNPDVGKIRCPYCQGLGKLGRQGQLLSEIREKVAGRKKRGQR